VSKTNNVQESSIPLFVDPAPLATREAWQADVVDRSQLGIAALGNLIEPLGINEVDDVTLAYDALQGLLDDKATVDDKTAHRVDALVDGLIRDALPQALRGNPFLYNATPAGRLVDIRPAVLANPLVQKIITGRDLQPASQKLREIWPHFKKLFINGVTKGIEQGYIPAAVRDRLEAALNQTRVRAVDAVVMDAHAGGLAGYYRSETDEVGIRHDIPTGGREYHSTLTHEVKHKVSGGTFKQSTPQDPHHFRSRVGYSNELPDGVYTRTGLNEAVTQHLAMGCLTDDFETFDPDERADGNRTYYRYRKVVATFINGARGLIDVKTVTNGFYEDSGPGGSTQDRIKLIRETVQAYGWGALAKLEKLCELADIVDAGRFEQIVLSRIHPAQVDENGNVLAKGYIDTKNLPDLDDLYYSQLTDAPYDDLLTPANS
jgi:hypothetical protein